jgi:GntR family transcriptional repressor for pyruvate dehydrogenase complex
LAALVEEIERENRNPHGTEKADRAFHLAIARATRNAAVAEAVERLWNLRADRPKARCCTKRPAAPTSSRWSRNTPPFSKPCAPATGRRPRRHAHPLASVLDSLLFATEEKAIAEARRASQARGIGTRRLLAEF